MLTLQRVMLRPPGNLGSNGMFMVVGLGNPGRRYVNTRHNVGFAVIETLAQRWSIPAEGKQLGALVGSGRIGDSKSMLVRPQSFMNRSGTPVQSLMGYFKVPAKSVVVLHDDLDLSFGRVQIKRGGGHGGHNGLRDLNKHVGSDYLRVRMGVGRPPEGWKTADYVLGQWTAGEKNELEGILETGANAVESILRDGVDAAMNVVNVRDSADKSSC